MPSSLPWSSLRCSLALSVAPVLVVLSGCGPRANADAQGGSAPPPAAVSTFVVTPADTPVTFEYVGQTIGSREVEIRARVGGILLKRHFREGAPVAKGQTMYTIDPAPLRVTLDRALADVAAAEARVAQASRTIARLKPLQAARAVSPREYDDAVSAEQVARADLKAAAARAAEAKLNLGYARVDAPIAGVAGRSQVSEGTLVRGPELLLTSISQIDPMHVLFGIADADQMRWRRDAESGRLELPRDGAFEVEVTRADGVALTRKGRLQFTEARISPATGTIEAQAEIANPDGALTPGQFVRVRLLGARRPSAALVPTRAVLEGPQGKFVYVVADGKAQPKPVTVGEQLGDRWVVTAGLGAGESVIVDGVMRIGPGAPVQVAPPGATASAQAPSAAASK